MEWTEYEIIDKAPASKEADRCGGDVSFEYVYDIRFRLLERTGMSASAAWSNMQNWPRSLTTKVNDPLPPGAIVHLPVPTKPDVDVVEYITTGSEKTMGDIWSAIVKDAAAKHAGQALVPLSLPQLYYMFENSVGPEAFRRLHEPRRDCSPQYDKDGHRVEDIRFSQVLAGKAVKYRLVKRPAVRITPATREVPERRGVVPENPKTQVVLPFGGIPNMKCPATVRLQSGNALRPVTRVIGADKREFFTKKDGLTFSIEVTEAIDKLTITIDAARIVQGKPLILQDETNIIFEHVIRGPCAPGVYSWTWHGFFKDGTHDVFDMRKFRTGLVVTVKTTQGAKTLASEPLCLYTRSSAKYATMRLDATTKRVNISVFWNYCQLVDSSHFQELVNAIVGQSSGFRTALQSLISFVWDKAKVPAAAIEFLKYRWRLPASSVAKMLPLISSGFRIFWSRDPGNLNFSPPPHVEIDGVSYDVSVNGEQTTRTTDIVMIYVCEAMDPWPRRACNPGVARQMSIPYTNLKVDLPWIPTVPVIVPYDSTLTAPEAISKEENHIRKAVAHEFGHTVLQAARDDNWSAGHKGATGTDIWTQEALPTQVTYPDGAAEIDLMQYYNGERPTDYHKRVIASTEDASEFAALFFVSVSEKP